MRQTERRTEALSKQRIVSAAIELLDAEGERGLTFRALAERLATGSGAIYWHVADKDELLAAAADHVVEQAMTGVDEQADPREAIRVIGMRMFDAIILHPWAGAQLNREPWRSATLRLFEGLGGGLLALGVPERAQFDAWSALVNYILGVAGQNAANSANARRRSDGTDRSAFLDIVAGRWEQLDPAEHPFVHRLAKQLREHDDREQFLAGIDLILAGVATLTERTAEGGPGAGVAAPVR